MGVTYTVDGNTVSTVRIESVELVDTAENGNVGVSRFTIDDTAGTLATTGHKTITVEEDDCATTLTAKGFVGTRSITRGTHRTLAGRDIQIEMRDLNELLNRRIFHVTGNRPRESIGDRLTWILGSSHLSGLVADNGFVVYPSTMMDKNDYRTMKPGDVLADCATRGNYNYFVYPDPTTGDASLWFDNSNTSTNYSSSLRISNVLSDIDWTTTFPVSPQATLSRNPDSVYGGVLLSYEGGRVWRHRAATAAAFVERDTVGPSSSVKRRARARALADNYLEVHRSEEDIIEDTVLVTSSKVNLIKAGMRIQARYSHMAPEGYSSFTWFRVLERRLRHVISPGGIPEAPDEPLYELSLRLSPQEAPPCEANAETVQLVQYGTVDGNALTGMVSLPAPATAGNLLVVVVGNRDEIALGPIGNPAAGWNYPPLVGSPFDTNHVQADTASGGTCECGHGSFYWKQADGGEQDYSIDTQAGAIFAEFSGFSGTILAISASAAETSNNLSAVVSHTSGTPGVPSLVVGSLVTRTKAAGSFAPGAGTSQVGGLMQANIDGSGSCAFLYGFSEDGSAVTLSGLMTGPYKDGHAAWGMRMGAFQVCPE